MQVEHCSQYLLARARPGAISPGASEPLRTLIEHGDAAAIGTAAAAQQQQQVIGMVSAASRAWNTRVVMMHLMNSRLTTMAWSRHRMAGGDDAG